MNAHTTHNTRTYTQEYGIWLRKLARARRAYADAYRNEDLETLAAYGYEVCVCVCVCVCVVCVCLGGARICV